MKKVVKVRACCWVCQHFVIDWNKEGEECELGHEIEGMNWEHVCQDFELWVALRPRRGDE